MATLEVRSLSYFASLGLVVDDASFTVREGHVAALLGDAGAGKTALLRLIAGLDQPQAGDVLLDDASVLRQRAHRRGVGLVFQDLALFPHLDVQRNVSFGLRMLGWPNADREHRVRELLELVGLARRGTERLDELTLAERQRVALARTLGTQPSVLLLDEPAGGGDETTRELWLTDLRRILHGLGTTTVVATRDVGTATALADDLVVIDRGHVLQAGSLHHVLRDPRSADVAALLGYVTLAHGVVRDAHVEEPEVGRVPLPAAPAEAFARPPAPRADEGPPDDTPDAPPDAASPAPGMPEALADGAPARVMAHPAALLAVPDDTGLGCGVGGEAVRARPLGPLWLVDVALGPRVIEARWEWDLVPPEPGTRLAIAAQPGTLRVFPALPAEGAAAPPPLLRHEPYDDGAGAVRPAERLGGRALDEPRVATEDEEFPGSIELRHRGMPLE